MNPKSLMTHSVTIKVPTLADDGMGGKTKTYGAGTASQALVAPMSAFERELRSRLGVVADYKVYLPDDVTVDERYLIDFGGRTFLVMGVTREGEGERQTISTKVADCREMKG